MKKLTLLQIVFFALMFLSLRNKTREDNYFFNEQIANCDTANYSYLLVDNNTYCIGSDVNLTVLDIFVLNKNYQKIEVIKHCNKIINIYHYQRKNNRKKRILKKNFKDYKKEYKNTFNEQLNGLGMPRISFRQSCSSYPTFTHLASGDTMSKFQIKKEYLQEGEQNQCVYEYFIVKHYWNDK